MYHNHNERSNSDNENFDHNNSRGRNVSFDDNYLNAFEDDIYVHASGVSGRGM